MTRTHSLAASTLLIAAGGSTAMAGLDTIPVTFSISMDSATFGDVTFSSIFDAEETDNGGGPVLFFQSKSGDWDSDSPFPLSYTNLSTTLDVDVLDGTFTMYADLGGSTLSADISFMGFGSVWDGVSASGTGVLSVANFSGGGGFTPESVSMSWSITYVPAPGALALLGVAGLSRRRRRD
jgi:hypothetical protein